MLNAMFNLNVLDHVMDRLTAWRTLMATASSTAELRAS